MLLRRALKSALGPGSVGVEGEHFLQVLEHVVEHSSAEAPLLEASPLPVHRLLVSLEVAVKVSLLVRLMMRVEVVLVLLTKRVKVFEDVIEIEVEGLVVLPEVVVVAAAASSTSSTSLVSFS